MTHDSAFFYCIFAGFPEQQRIIILVVVFFPREGEIGWWLAVAQSAPWWEGFLL